MNALRSIWALAAALWLGAAAASAAPLAVPPLGYTERLLPNGLQVIAVQDRGSPTVSVQVWYHVGSKDDPPGRSGFAHLFEHMLFKSTRYLKAEQFDRLTEDVGGSNNAFTAEDVTAYQDVVPSNHLETLLWAEAERMSNLEVDDAAFKSERAVVEEEYRQRVLASPYGRFFNAVSAGAYQLHPYKRPTIGSIEDLEAATLDDVRAFHASYYRPDNATLIVAGDFEPGQLQAWIDKYFGAIRKPDTPIPRVTMQEPPWTADREIAVSGPQVPLPAVALVWQAPPVSTAEAPALRVAAALLGAGESARLNQALVYRQQIASQAGFEADLRAGPSQLIAYAVAAGGNKPADVMRSLSAEVLRLAERPVSPAELAKVKIQLLTASVSERETPRGKASALAEAAVLHDSTAKANRMLAELQQVSAADVQRVMQRLVKGAPKVVFTYTQDTTGSGAADAAKGPSK